MASGTVV